MEVDQDALEEAIQEFGAWRLLSFDRDPRSGTPTIEVAHEALMREWGRFRRWIDSGREEVRLHRRLATAAREWEDAGREPSYLLRGSNLVQFELLAGESAIALTELEREFVEASTAANELELARQRRQNRRLRTLLAGAVGLLVLAVVAGALALVSRSNAQHEAKVALGRQLGAEAVSQPRIDLAMLLARESLNLDRSTQTEGTLLATLLRAPTVIGTFTMPIEDRPQDVKVSPDGRTIAAITNNGVMRLYSTRKHQQVGKFPLGNTEYAYVPTTGDILGLAPPTPTPTENGVAPRRSANQADGTQLRPQQALGEFARGGGPAHGRHARRSLRLALLGGRQPRRQRRAGVCREVAARQRWAVTARPARGEGHGRGRSTTRRQS